MKSLKTRSKNFHDNDDLLKKQRVLFFLIWEVCERVESRHIDRRS